MEYSIMAPMLNDYTISFRDLEFEGLKFRRSKSFPEAEFNKLLDEDFPWSESRCIELSDAQTLERIHRYLSIWIICRLASFVVMGFALILVSARLPWTSVLTAVVGLGLFLLSQRMRGRANSDYQMRDGVRAMIHMVFEERRNRGRETGVGAEGH